MAIKVEIDEKKKTVTIVAPLEEPTASGSGKNLVIASTHGSEKTDAEYEGKQVVVGLNVYISAKG